jgi:ankyrin repeat protein
MGYLWMKKQRIFEDYNQFWRLVIAAIGFLATLTGALWGYATYRQASLDAALLRAARRGDFAVTTALLSRGANVDARDADENTSLAIAAKTGNADICKALLDSGADAKAMSIPYHGFPARDVVLTHAAQGGNPEVIRLLLSRGAKVDACGGMGVTPLMLAAQDNHIEAVKLLLAHGANVNAKDERGFTVLSFAQARRKTDHSQILRLLRQAGAR